MLTSVESRILGRTLSDHTCGRFGEQSLRNPPQVRNHADKLNERLKNDHNDG